MTYEWSPRKAAQNRTRHGVSFEEAATVFLDPLATTYSDPDPSDDEDREITIGSSTIRRLLFVAHVLRSERVRLISARPVTPRERRQHEQGGE